MIFWKLTFQMMYMLKIASLFGPVLTKYHGLFPKMGNYGPFQIWDLSIPSEWAPSKLRKSIKLLNLDHQNSNYRPTIVISKLSLHLYFVLIVALSLCCLQVSTGSYEKLVFQVSNGKHITDPSALDKIVWSSWTRWGSSSGGSMFSGGWSGSSGGSMFRFPT